MRIIFSRKGFDLGSGGAPSPIVDGRALSLPIPAADGRSLTTYADIGLAEHVERATRGRIRGDVLVHEDPMFFDGRCVFGQCAAAQGHLANQGVAPGDVFLFFGLYADPDTGQRHHRIFGWQRIERIVALGRGEGFADPTPRPHPHLGGFWDSNNTLYVGPGRTGAPASDALRLTMPGGPLRHWRVPEWLAARGLTYHARADRWGRGSLHTVSRGQEFVTHIGKAQAPHRWLAEIIAEIEG